jgi:hypothetical protein
MPQRDGPDEIRRVAARLLQLLKEEPGEQLVMGTVDSRRVALDGRFDLLRIAAGLLAENALGGGESGAG